MPVHAIRRLAAAIVAGAAAAAASLAAAGPVAAHGYVPPDPPSAANLLLHWDIQPLLIVPLVAAGMLWWRLVDAVDRAHPDHRVPRRQRWSFLAGLFAIALALQSGIERYDDTLFSVHMVQHLLLTMGAPPLLALGAPVTQLLRASSPAVRQRWLLPFLHGRLVAVLANPVVAWLAFAGVMWGTHYAPIFNASLEDPLTHDAEHALYLTAGLLFWLPAVALDPAPGRMGHAARMGYLFLQMPQNSFLAMTILFASGPLYPHYVGLNAPYGIDALTDQRLAAGIMWVVGDLVFLGAMFAVLAGWMRSEERSLPATDRRAAAELAVIREREAELRRRRGLPPDQAGPGVSIRER